MDEDDSFVAQVCHIEAAAPGGERYNPAMTDEERRSNRNLLIMCYRHHVKTNNVSVYTVERLREIKERHEAQFLGDIFQASEHVIGTVSRSLGAYWQAVGIANKLEHPFPEHSVSIDAELSFPKLFDSLREDVEFIKTSVGSLEKYILDLRAETLTFLRQHGLDTAGIEKLSVGEVPFDKARTWETRNLALPNGFTQLELLIDQIEIAGLSYFVALHPSEAEVVESLRQKQQAFLEAAASKVLHD